MSVENVAETFVNLADTLVADFDPVEFMHLLADRCVATLDVDAAGILLVNQYNELQTVGASSEQARVLELFELQQRQGPCMECYRTRAAVGIGNFAQGRQKWPEFSAMALTAGFGALHALPMRLRTETIGALNLFCVRPGGLDDAAIRIAQAMADVATIGLLQARAISHSELLAEQLQHALHGRVLIEQAKGVLAERLQVEMSEAFEILRRYARNHNAFISAVAEGVITGRVNMAMLTGTE
jgi:hypothetical protein